jgi:hypothetical protein
MKRQFVVTIIDSDSEIGKTFVVKTDLASAERTLNKAFAITTGELVTTIKLNEAGGKE